MELPTSPTGREPSEEDMWVKTDSYFIELTVDNRKEIYEFDDIDAFLDAFNKLKPLCKTT